MSQKELYVQALQSLPEALQAFEDTVIPDIEATWMPDNEQDAQIVCGILAHNLNKIFFVLKGLPLIQLALRVGTRNNVLRDLLLSGLEGLDGSGSLHSFVVISPQGGTVVVGDVLYSIRIDEGVEDLIQATVTLEGWTTTLVPEDEHPEICSYTGSLPAGAYTADFIVRFQAGDGGEYVARQTVTFDAQGYW